MNINDFGSLNCRIITEKLSLNRIKHANNYGPKLTNKSNEIQYTIETKHKKTCKMQEMKSKIYLP